MISYARILVLYTGGTIGMKMTPRGFAPVPGALHSALSAMPTFNETTEEAIAGELMLPVSRYGRRIAYRIVEYSPLLDSSNMGMKDWVRIARDIEAAYDAYDAFVVLHGTDTMAYTASALSFMLENLGKSVVLTGSQIPLSQARNDAGDNLLGALTIAGHFEIPEVCLFFRSKLMRGNRTRKVDAAGFDAFRSSNCLPLANVGIGIEVQWGRVRTPPDRPLEVRSIDTHDVVALRLFPGISADLVRNALRPPLRGAVLETFGSGNAPDNRPDLMEALGEATRRGVVIVNCTQCHRGTVSAAYASGRALAAVGVVPGLDMTTEAALTKLAYLLSRSEYTPADVARLVQRDLRGELTERSTARRFSFRERRFISSVARVLASGGAPEDRVAIAQTMYPVLLCAAASVGDLDAVRRMLADGASVDAANYDGRTALHLAAAEGQHAVVQLLLAEGARLSPVDRWGGTPLRDATRGDHTEVAALLRSKGATLTWTDDVAVFGAAARAGDLAEVRRLIDRGVDVSAGDYDGRTALHQALRGGHAEIAMTLLHEGANPLVRDRKGRTALDEAMRRGDEALAATLREAIAERLDEPVPTGERRWRDTRGLLDGLFGDG